METTVELKHLLKSLRLSPLLTTLPERVAYAKGNKLTHLEFLEMLFSDEVERRSQDALQRRLKKAKVDHDQVLELGVVENSARGRRELEIRPGKCPVRLLRVGKVRVHGS